jgi:hypothetical protein
MKNTDKRGQIRTDTDNSGQIRTVFGVSTFAKVTLHEINKNGQMQTKAINCKKKRQITSNNVNSRQIPTLFDDF